MGAVLALASSVLWGTSDFVGGTLSRRAHPVAVLRTSQALAAVALWAVVLLAGEAGESGAVVWGVVGGVVGMVALAAFYAALASGTMGVVAPIASTGAIVPVAIGLLQGEEPSGAQVVGIAVAIVGVVLASGPGGDDTVEPVEPVDTDDANAPAVRSLRPMALAAVAAIGFGGTLVIVAEGSEHSVGLTLALMRTVNAGICTLLLATALRAVARPERRLLPALGGVGLVDAAANGTYALATHTSLVSVASVLASLYPAVTALLARRFHEEHLRPIQVAGVVAILVGVVLIAAG